MKKNSRLILAALLSVSLICAGCSDKTETVTDETTALISEMTFTSSEDFEPAQVLEEEPETVAETEPPEEAPSELKELFKKINDTDGYISDMIIGLSPDGSYELIDGENYYSVYYIDVMTSRETYEEYMEYMAEDEKMSYEDFKKEMYDMMDVTEEDVEKYSSYSAIYVVDYYSEDENADHSEYAARGFEHAAEMINTSRIDNTPVFIQIIQQDAAITINAGYSDKNGENVYILEDEKICIYGDGYVLIGSAAVPKNTKSLYITTDDAKWDSYFNSTAADEYESFVFDYPGEPYYNYGTSSKKIPELDLTDFAENFPNLQKLYLSEDLPVKGIDGLGKYGSFEELSISAWHYRDYANDEFLYLDEIIGEIKSIPDLKRLHLGNISMASDIEWAKDMDSELVIDCDCDDELQKYIYTMPNVTGLFIRTSHNGYTPDFTGIEGCKSLKTLSITTDYVADHEGYADAVPDFAPLAKTSLEELKISGDNAKNLDAIGKIKTLKRLSIHGLTYNENRERGVDLSVFKNCTSLEYLDLYDTDDSILTALPYMKNLKTLKLGEGSGYFYYGLEDIKGADSVEELIFDKVGVSMKGISELDSLSTLTFDDCELSDTDELNKCKKLKKISISIDEFSPYDKFDPECIRDNGNIEELYLKHTGIMHYKNFKNLTTLKKLTLDCTDLTEEQTAELKEEMPWCEVEAVKYVPADEKEAEELAEYKSMAEPDETVFIGDVRIEKYPDNSDYWDATWHIKNCGDTSIADLTKFLYENGLTEGYGKAIIYYSEHDGHADVTEIMEITDGNFDDDTLEVYLGALDVYEEDYVENRKYRELVPDEAVTVIFHIPDEEDKKQNSTEEST